MMKDFATMNLKFGLSVVGLLIGLGTGQAFAQNNPQDTPPAPEQVALETKDGVQLSATWYAGVNKKESIPVIMLHDWDGNRKQFSGLATYLQSIGHSVIVPDLRGHGESLRVKGSDMTLDREKFNRNAIAAMGEDIEACKRFLLKKNNGGELNIEFLTVVAAGQSAVLASQWAVKDWSWPVVAGRKQGQDVKALVLLSPEKTFKGLTLNSVMRTDLLAGGGPRMPLSIMVAVGARNARSAREAKTLYSNFQKKRPELELTGTPAERQQQVLEKQDLFIEELPVDYQGVLLVDPRANLGLPEKIGGFLYYRLLNKKDAMIWRDRSRK